MKKFHLHLEWKFELDACSVIGLHVEIFRHKKVLYLNDFSWGLLLNNGEKNTVVLNNRRHLLMISHKQRNTAEFLRIPCFRIVPPGIFHKESPQEIKKRCKEARPHRPSSEYLDDFARKFTRGLQETKFHCARVSTSSRRMPACAILLGLASMTLRQ